MQNKKEVYLALLLPSAIGAVFYTSAAGMVIALSRFSFIEQYLQLPDNMDFPRMLLNWLDHTGNRLLGKSNTEVVVVGLFWALVGLAVFIFLRGMAKFIGDLSDGLDARRYMWPQGVGRNHAMREAVLRAAFRLLAFICLVIAVLALLPWESRRLAGLSGPLQYLIWFAIFWLTLHLLVIFARLIMLKPRLLN